MVYVVRDGMLVININVTIYEFLPLSIALNVRNNRCRKLVHPHKLSIVALSECKLLHSGTCCLLSQGSKNIADVKNVTQKSLSMTEFSYAYIHIIIRSVNLNFIRPFIYNVFRSYRPLHHNLLRNLFNFWCFNFSLHILQILEFYLRDSIHFIFNIDVSKIQFEITADFRLPTECTLT